MSVFLLPVNLCQDLEKLMCRYWWRSDSKKDRCIHWLSWENMCKRKSAGGMGFRSLRDFNIALLGNQGWRLLTYPDRLVNRVFKARYYPQGSFLNANLGRNPSFIWCSVLESQPILKQGAGCRVGNGVSIKILEDTWLPSDIDPYVHTTSAALQNQMVSSLLDIDSGQWDVDLVLDVFESRDANIILSIPLNSEVNDSWYWRREKLGNYSVKSAYLLMQENKPGNDTQANSGFWRTLWNLKIPPKVRNFLWRASANCLPTKDMLRIKRVRVNKACPSCNVYSETIMHTIVSCSYAISCWEKLSILSISGDYFSFAEWLQLVFQQQRREEIHIIAIVCWMLWKSRNELVWNQHSLEPSEVVESAFSVLNQWKSVQDKTFDHFMGYMTHEDGVEHWQPPVFNRVKVNTDATIFEDLNCFSHALVIRNHEGVLVEARSKCMRGNPSPDLAEAIGIREALSWVKDAEQADVVIESDCLQVVQAIRSSFVCYSYLGRVIMECRNILASLSNKNIMFRFVKRSANRVAHYLARYSYSIADRIWRAGDVHSEFNHVLSNDLRY